MNDTFGTTSHAFSEQSLMRIAAVLQRRTVAATQAQINAALALLGAIAPRDELDTAIGEQIVTAHVLSMELMHQAKCSDTIPKMDAYTNMATKVSRTMATHIDALGKLRCGGKQQMIVRHVYVQGDAYVGDNGQAVFGGVEAQGGGAATGNPVNPMSPAFRLFAAARCGAKSRAGTPCRLAAMNGRKRAPSTVVRG